MSYEPDEWDGSFPVYADLNEPTARYGCTTWALIGLVLVLAFLVSL